MAENIAGRCRRGLGLRPNDPDDVFVGDVGDRPVPPALELFPDLALDVGAAAFGRQLVADEVFGHRAEQGCMLAQLCLAPALLLDTGITTLADQGEPVSCLVAGV